MPRWPEIRSAVKAAHQRVLARITGKTSGPAGSRTLRWTAAIFAAAIILCIGIVATFDWNLMRGPLQNYLSSRLQRDVRIGGDLDVTLFSWTPSASLNGLVVEQPDWVRGQDRSGESFAEIERLAVSIDLRELFTGRVVLPEVTVTRPQFRLLREASGRANWRSDPDAEDTPLMLPPIRHFVIEDGRVDLVDAKKKLVFNGTFSSEEGRSGPANVFELDGKGQLNRRPFALRMTGDPLLNVEPDQPYGFKGDVRAGDTRIVAQGALGRPFDLGAFEVKVTFSGSDLADLYYLTGLALPNTAPYRVSGDLTRERHNWRFERFDGRVGDSDVHGTIDVDASGEKPYLKGDLASRQLDFDDLGPVFGSPPAVGPGETASPEQQAEARELAAAARALSDKPLDVERLRQMDADVHFRADKVRSRDFPLRAADATVSLSNGILNLDPVSVAFDRGSMAGSMRVDATKNVAVTDIDARFTRLRLEEFVTGLGNPPALEGAVLARVKLQGVGNSVHRAASTANGSLGVVVPRGQIRQSFAELMGVNIARALLVSDRNQTEVRCGVAEFTAKDGVLNLHQFVFDTDVVQVSGEGTVNLQSEQMNLRLTGHPKEFRLVRLRAPITIGGPISRPDVGADAGGALAQGGLAAGLGFLLSPLAALLPFVDPGLAEDADCAALLSKAQVPVAAAEPSKR